LQSSYSSYTFILIISASAIDRSLLVDTFRNKNKVVYGYMRESDRSCARIADGKNTVELSELLYRNLSKMEEEIKNRAMAAWAVRENKNTSIYYTERIRILTTVSE